MRFEDATGMSRETAVEIICEHIASGQSLRAACKSDALPDKSTFLRWMEEDVELRRQYMRARELQAEYFADEMIGIADGVRQGATSEEIQAAKLAIDTRKWIASKLLPRQYGDRTVNEHVGDPDNPIKTITRVEVVFVRPDDQAARSLPTLDAADAVQGRLRGQGQREIALLCEQLDSESDC